MFSIQYRNNIFEYVIILAHSDPRVVAGAVVGSLALSEGDRWSDIDLTFGVADDVPIREVLEDWTNKLIEEFQAVHLFDLSSGPSIYRVFLMPGCLQFDLSFTPALQFGAAGPKFRLLFGNGVEKPFPQPPSLHELFGYTVHHILRARFCIKRGRYWQAEHWISSARDYTLRVACQRRGLPIYNGKGFDDLPAEFRDVSSGSLVASFEHDELLRALHCAIDGLYYEVEGVEELAGKVKPMLYQLVASWEG
jgi:hypothetical protein